MISNSFSLQASPVERRLLILLGVISLALVGGALMLAQLRVWEKHQSLGG